MKQNKSEAPDGRRPEESQAEEDVPEAAELELDALRAMLGLDTRHQPADPPQQQTDETDNE